MSYSVEKRTKQSAIDYAQERANREGIAISVWRTIRENAPCYWVRSNVEDKPELSAILIEVLNDESKIEKTA